MDPHRAGADGIRLCRGPLRPVLRELEAAQHIEHHSGHGVSLWLGIALVALGVFLNLAALARYRRYLQQLAQGILPAARPRLETVLAAVLSLLGLGAVLYLLFIA